MHIVFIYTRDGGKKEKEATTFTLCTKYTVEEKRGQTRLQKYQHRYINESGAGGGNGVIT